MGLCLIGFFLFCPSQGLAFALYPSQLGTPPTVVVSGDATYSYPASVALNGSIFSSEEGKFSFSWLRAVAGGTEAHCSDSATLGAGQVFNLPECIVDGLAMGEHYFTLSVSYSQEDTETTVLSDPVKITIADDAVPTLAPVADPAILWPPNNKLVRVVVTPNASDNSGEPPALSAFVTSNEPVRIVGKARKWAAWNTPTYNQDGTITFWLPAQRLGKGTGRVYTITVVATDASKNYSSADVTVLVPHDRGKKKGR